MEYITYAHILNGEVYEIGDFGAVALWYVLAATNEKLGWKRFDRLGCRLDRIWMTYIPYSRVGCGDYIINSQMRDGNDFSMNSFRYSTRQSNLIPKVRGLMGP